MSNETQDRILLVDDNADIHDDFRIALDIKKSDAAISEIKSKLFGKKTVKMDHHQNLMPFIIDSAYQGDEALISIQKAIEESFPYSLAFVDIRMPPGLDGIETIQRIWTIDPDIEIVICTAFSDYSWENINEELKYASNFIILKKPFDAIEIRQMAFALTKKWRLERQVKEQILASKSMTKILEHSLSLMKTTLESTQEGILVLDRDNKMVMFNNIFKKIWNISDTVSLTPNLDNFINELSNQVQDESLFFKVMLNASSQASTNNIKKWKLKSGKIVELYICPQYLHDEIIGHVYSFRDITEWEHLNEELLRQATHDGLTGLPNRILLADRIKQAILEAKRFNLQVGVCLFDLDNFKEVNDSIGHGCGDVLLQMVAKKASSCMREADTLTRLGGDEFLAVLPAQSGEKNISLQAQRLLETISMSYQIENHEIIVTASIGIAVYPTDGDDSETLLKNADSALYCAKRAGRNNFQFYTPALNEQVLQKLELTTALRMAIEKNQLSLHYQPLVELPSKNIVGFEALLRWQHPTLGEISPNLFIPLAEEAGLIQSIGDWVLRKSCIQIKLWQQAGYDNLKVAVNISVKQFQQKNFIESIEAILNEIQLEPVYLELEITESIILNNLAEAIQKMDKLKKIGVGLAVDDFGTGYSSLSYLKYFSFDKLKIDKNFIDGIGKNSSDNAIIEAIISIAKQLGISVLAEGVENEEQLDFIDHHHGNQIQGYYFSRPLNEKDCTRLLEQAYSTEETAE